MIKSLREMYKFFNFEAIKKCAPLKTIDVGNDKPKTSCEDEPITSQFSIKKTTPNMKHSQ